MDPAVKPRDDKRQHALGARPLIIPPTVKEFTQLMLIVELLPAIPEPFAMAQV